LMNLDNLADWEVSGEQGELQKSANI
jgi:hypothetical protein